MITEETIYTGNSLNEAANNESDSRKLIAKAWKPVTIGGSAGIMLGTGAIVMTSTQDDMEIMDDNTTVADDLQTRLDTQLVESVEAEASDAAASDEANDMTELLVATVDDKLPFSYAFASARDQVGPGGIFNWRSVIFSTYTADEWDAMSEEEHARFAERVHPEVAANDVSKADLEEHIAMAPVDDVVIDEDFDEGFEDDLLAENIAVEDTDGNLDMAQEIVEETAAEENDMAQAVVDDAAMAMIDKDMAEASAPTALGQQQADVEISAQDVVDDFEVAQLDDVMIADEADDTPIEDIAIADLDEDDEEFALSEMFDLKPVDDLAMATPATKASDGGVPFENFLSDNTVRIVGYGEFDGHQVRGLDLNGDERADIAVIDIDDSGDLSGADMIVEQGNGNQFTYGELQDFAMAQEHGGEHHEATTPNPDIADDMPDYMDDAMAQL